MAWNTRSPALARACQIIVNEARWPSELATLTRAEFPDLSPWFFASLSVEDPLGHRSAAVGLAYLADQVLGRPLLAEERARRAEAEALAPGTLLAVREDSPDGAWLRVEASVGGQIVQGWMHRATVTFASRPLDSALVSRP